MNTKDRIKITLTIDIDDDRNNIQEHKRHEDATPYRVADSPTTHTGGEVEITYI